MNIVTETLVNGALGASGVLAWRWDLKGRRIDWSPGAEDVLGLPDIVLRSPELLIRAIHPDDLPLVRTAYASALRRGDHMDARFRIVGSKGVRWVDCAGQATLDELGKACVATGTMVDVTEECEAEEAMLETLHEADVVLSALGARVWEWDSETGKVTYLRTPTGPPILADEERPTLTIAMERFSDQEASMIRATLLRAVETGDPFSFEATTTDDNGVRHRVFVRGASSPKSPGRLTGVSIILD